MVTVLSREDRFSTESVSWGGWGWKGDCRRKGGKGNAVGGKRFVLSVFRWKRTDRRTQRWLKKMKREREESDE